MPGLNGTLTGSVVFNRSSGKNHGLPSALRANQSSANQKILKMRKSASKGVPGRTLDSGKDAMKEELTSVMPKTVTNVAASLEFEE